MRRNGGHVDAQTQRERDTYTETQTNRQTDRHTDKQTNTPTNLGATEVLLLEGVEVGVEHGDGRDVQDFVAQHQRHRVIRPLDNPRIALKHGRPVLLLWQVSTCTQACMDGWMDADQQGDIQTNHAGIAPSDGVLGLW
jgi:hypothetical protein